MPAVVRAAPVLAERDHALASLLPPLRAIGALAVEVVDLLLGQPFELRAQFFRASWLHLQDLLRRMAAYHGRAEGELARRRTRIERLIARAQYTSS